MTSEKKLILRRLIIYLILSFLPLCIAIPVLNNVMGGLIFDGEMALLPVASLVGFLAMMCPAIANILTRIITKEGFKNTYLRANFKGNMKYYALAVVIPVAYGLVAALTASLVYGTYESGITPIGRTAIVIIQIETAILTAFYAMGEEFGWRGYMMPKLEKLFGTPASILVGGVIWGLWHMPLTCSGHNFGTEYPGYPFVGIGLMCLMCIFLGCILTYITKKTKSVYPASILHMVNNNVSSFITVLFVSSETTDSIGLFLILLIPMFLISVVTFILSIKRKSNINTL